MADELLRERAATLAQTLVHDLALLVAGHDPSLEYVEPAIGTELRASVEPLLQSGRSVRPDFGLQSNITVRAEGASGPRVEVAMFDLSTLEERDGTVAKRRDRQLLVTFTTDFSASRVLSLTIQPGLLEPGDVPIAGTGGLDTGWNGTRHVTDASLADFRMRLAVTVHDALAIILPEYLARLRHRLDGGPSPSARACAQMVHHSERLLSTARTASEMAMRIPGADADVPPWRCALPLLRLLGDGCLMLAAQEAAQAATTPDEEASEVPGWVHAALVTPRQIVDRLASWSTKCVPVDSLQLSEVAEAAELHQWLVVQVSAQRIPALPMLPAFDTDAAPAPWIEGAGDMRTALARSVSAFVTTEIINYCQVAASLRSLLFGEEDKGFGREDAPMLAEFRLNMLVMATAVLSLGRIAAEVARLPAAAGDPDDDPTVVLPSLRLVGESTLSFTALVTDDMEESRRGWDEAWPADMDDISAALDDPALNRWLLAQRRLGRLVEATDSPAG